MMESVDAVFCWLNLLESEIWTTERNGG